ncbi:MAG: hypothetical protein ACKVT0_11830 [Planctomycetaceae bacterium]
MEQILIPSLVGTVVLLPAILSLTSALLRRSGEERAFHGLNILWGLRAVLAVLLAVWWMVAEPSTLAAYESHLCSIWRDDSLPELTLSVRFDRLAMIFLAMEAILSAAIFPSALPRSSTTRTPQPEAWLYFGCLTSAVDLFVLSSHLLLTLGCGILIVRIYDWSHRTATSISDTEPEKSFDAAYIKFPSVLRWGEVGMWLTLLLAWQFFDDGAYAALCDSGMQQKVHAENPAAIPVISCCLIGVALVLGRFFPFMILDQHVRNESDIDGLQRSLIVWPLGFWLLFRLAPLWENVPVACQLLGLAGTVTAVLASVLAGVGHHRSEIFAWCTMAHAGIIAMLFSTGSPVGLSVGLVFLACHAPARLLMEMVLVSPPANRFGRPAWITMSGVVAALALLAAGAGGQGILLSILAMSSAAGGLSEATGFSETIIGGYPWIAIAVLCGEAWSLLRCMALPDGSTSFGDDPRRAKFLVPFAMTIAAGVVSTWKMDLVMSVLFPMQHVNFKELVIDASLVGILSTGVMLSGVGAWLLYRVNPDWRRPLGTIFSPLRKISDRHGFLPEAWRLMFWQPLEYIIDLAEFCEQKILPSLRRLCGIVGSSSVDNFLKGLEHGNVRLYGLTVALTTVVMLCLFLFPIG